MSSFSLQEYFDNLVSEASIRIKHGNDTREKNSDLFSKLEDLSLIDDDEYMKKWYEASVYLNDTRNSFNKVASFIYFMKNVKDIDIDYSSIKEVQGLPEFIKEFDPFREDSYINSNGDVVMKDIIPEIFELFKENIRKNVTGYGDID